jgi:hypothetical protein
VVGDPIRTGGGTAELTTALRADYDAAAAGGRTGPASMYEPLARSLVAAAPVPLAGRGDRRQRVRARVDASG